MNMKRSLEECGFVTRYRLGMIDREVEPDQGVTLQICVEDWKSPVFVFSLRAAEDLREGIGRLLLRHKQ